MAHNIDMLQTPCQLYSLHKSLLTFPFFSYVSVLNHQPQNSEPIRQAAPNSYICQRYLFATQLNYINIFNTLVIFSTNISYPLFLLICKTTTQQKTLHHSTRRRKSTQAFKTKVLIFTSRSAMFQFNSLHTSTYPNISKLYPNMLFLPLLCSSLKDMDTNSLQSASPQHAMRR